MLFNLYRKSIIFYVVDAVEQVVLVVEEIVVSALEILRWW